MCDQEHISNNAQVALRERVYPFVPDWRQEKFLSVKDTVLASNVEQGADPQPWYPNATNDLFDATRRINAQ